MRSGKARISVATALALAALSSCGQADRGVGSGDAGQAAGVALPVISGPNVMSLTVNGANCAAGSYINKPCVRVTICPVGSTGADCQTVSDIVLDTGSYGLRVFRSALTPALDAQLSPVVNQGTLIGECVTFADGSSDWGQVSQAGIILGQEPAVTSSIQVIDSAFSGGAADCAGANSSVAQAGFNGILGVGLFASDCGEGCATEADNGFYFSCDGAQCTGTPLDPSLQVTNPVPLLPADNNGLIIQLPALAAGGAGFANGYAVLGISTQANNQVGAVTPYLANPQTGDFTTSIGGSTYPSGFLDTGSNALFFAPPQSDAIPECPDQNQVDWYCPSGATGFSALNQAFQKETDEIAMFTLGNADSIFNTSYGASNQLGANPGDGGHEFDWGLPFYFGRAVYVGIEDKTSSLGTGPYWAF